MFGYKTLNLKQKMGVDSYNKWCFFKKNEEKNKLMHVMVTKTNKLEAIENRSKCVNRFAKENYTVMQT